MGGGVGYGRANRLPDVVCHGANWVIKVTIRMNGSSLGLSFDPRGAGSSPARDFCFPRSPPISFGLATAGGRLPYASILKAQVSDKSE